MKTVVEKDLITWSNRDKAVIGNLYYCGLSKELLEGCIAKAKPYELTAIRDDSYGHPFSCKNPTKQYDILTSCLLPIDKVYEVEENENHNIN